MWSKVRRYLGGDKGPHDVAFAQAVSTSRCHEHSLPRLSDQTFGPRRNLVMAPVIQISMPAHKT
jgi:hypothetical protein